MPGTARSALRELTVTRERSKEGTAHLDEASFDEDEEEYGHELVDEVGASL